MAVAKLERSHQSTKRSLLTKLQWLQRFRLFGVCKIQDECLVIPHELRSQYLSDPSRNHEWRKLLKEFDHKWGESVQTPTGSTHSCCFPKWIHSSYTRLWARTKPPLFGRGFERGSLWLGKCVSRFPHNQNWHGNEVPHRSSPVHYGWQSGWGDHWRDWNHWPTALHHGHRWWICWNWHSGVGRLGLEHGYWMVRLKTSFRTGVSMKDPKTSASGSNKICVLVLVPFQKIPTIKFQSHCHRRRTQPRATCSILSLMLTPWSWKMQADQMATRLPSALSFRISNGEGLLTLSWQAMWSNDLVKYGSLALTGVEWEVGLL